MSLVCMRHPKYKGEGKPDLACKNCCTIFMDVLVQKTREEKELADRAAEVIVPSAGD